MFLNPNPAAHPATESLAGLYPILTAAELLAHAKHKQLLLKVKKNSGLDEKNFNETYEIAINHFVEFVQALPIKIGGKLGGLMHYGLERGNLALEAYKNQAGEDFNTRHAYAIFTMGLFLDVGLTVNQQKVMISDERGEFLEEWSPFEGSLIAKGKYYKLRFVLNRWQILGKLATILLARQLMTEVGFLWIAQDEELLQMWLAALAGDEGIANRTLVDLLQLVNKQLAEAMQKDSLPQLTLHPAYPQETIHGESFAAWLINGIHNGTIAVDQADASVLSLPSGDLLLDPKIFQKFSEEYKRVDKWEVIAGQFNNLGFTKLGDKEVSFARFYERFPERAPAGQGAKKGMGYFLTSPLGAAAKVRQGLVVTKPHLILNGHFPVRPFVDLQPVNTDLVKDKAAETALESIIDKQRSVERKYERRTRALE